MGLVWFLLFTQLAGSCKCVVSCRLVPLAISKTAVIYSGCHWCQNSVIVKNEIKLSLPHLNFLSNLKGKEASAHLHFKFKICI